MNIALFGGSFNPPHVSHLMAAVWVASTTDVDRVWFVPTYRHAFGKQLVDFDTRCRLLSRAIEPLGSWAELSRVERDLGIESRTIDTLRHLQRTRPDDSFSLVVGADVLLESHKWKQFDELERLAPFHVVGRSGTSVPQRRFAIELPDISSTEIRARLRNGDLEYCTSRVPKRVLDLIIELGLYQYQDQTGDKPVSGGDRC